jgi:CHAT domain-containing protein/Flp pilus assembly protein TadD
MRRRGGAIRAVLLIALVVGLGATLTGVAPPAAEWDRLHADWMYEFGALVYTAGKGDALPVFERSLALYRGIEDRQGEASSLLYLGSCYEALEDFQKAIECHEYSLAISYESGDRAGEAASLDGLGRCYGALENFQKAIECHEKSLAISHELGDRVREAVSLNGLGRCYEALADYWRAIECHEKSLAISHELGDRPSEASSLNNLSVCYELLGEYRKAADLLEQSRMIKKETEELASEAADLSSLGSWLHSLGYYRRAIEFCEESLAISLELGDRAGAATCLNSLGNSYCSLGDYGKAVDLYDQSLAISYELGDRAGASAILNNLGNSYVALGDYRKAVDLYDQSRAISYALGDRAGAAATLVNLGNCLYFIGGCRGAIGFYEQALVVFKELRASTSEAMTLNNLGRCHFSLGDYRKAIEYYEQGLAAVAASARSMEGPWTDPESLWRLQVGLGSCHKALGDLPGASAAWREAVTVIEEMRGMVGTAALASSFMEDKLSVYGQLVPTLVQIGELEESAFYAERGKARTLVDMMETAMISRPEILPSEVQSGSNAVRELGALERAGDALGFQPVGGLKGGAEANGTRASVQAATQRTQVEYDAFLAELERENPALGDTLSVNAERLAQYCADVTGKLGESTVALEYFVTDAETIVWVITEDGIQTASRIVVSRDDLAQAVRSFRDVIQTPSSQAMFDMAPMEQGSALYDLLIAPVEEYLVGAEHLVIIPSDVLFYVPFAALYYCPGCQGGSLLGGQYLIERFTLSYAPSLASLYWPLQHEGDGNYTSVLSVGNPTGDLLAAEAEATTVAGLFPDATLLLREEGTEARVKAELVAREYDVVHLSTHGLFDPAMPLLSEVVLREGTGEDGHLCAGEILGLSLSQTELVVMSACQTALPPEISQDVVVGDEIQGLGQALFVAGVPTALLTLWNVNDASTSELMIEFYKSLMSPGDAKAQSLAESQRALLRGDYGLSYRHPYYWAPFVMYGDWR